MDSNLALPLSQRSPLVKTDGAAITARQTRPDWRKTAISKVKGKNSAIEMAVRRALWARGLRYRIHYQKATGHPDIAFPRQKLAIFIDGEFWHGFNWDERRNDHKQNPEFWIKKIEANIKRDQQNNRQLEAEGWTVRRFWGKETRLDPDSCVDEIVAVLSELRLKSNSVSSTR